jgi:hypothetical protein
MADGADEARASTVRALAAALGLGKSRLAELTKEPWWPARGGDGAWDVAACRAAYDANVRGREQTAPISGAAPGPGADPQRAGATPGPTPGAAPAPPPARRELDDRDRQLVEALRGDADAVAKIRASVDMLARRLADGITGEGAVPARVAGDMATLARELRVAEAQLLEVQRSRGDLVERDVARATCAALGTRFVAGVEALVGGLATQVEVWLGDPAFRALATDQRAVAVRAWAERQARATRAAAAAELEHLVAGAA